MAPTWETPSRQRTSYSYDSYLDPQLVWAGKAERTSFQVDGVSLHIHERISTKAILQAVRQPGPAAGARSSVVCWTPVKRAIRKLQKVA